MFGMGRDIGTVVMAKGGAQAPPTGQRLAVLLGMATKTSGGIEEIFAVLRGFWPGGGRSDGPRPQEPHRKNDSPR